MSTCLFAFSPCFSSDLGVAASKRPLESGPSERLRGRPGRDFHFGVSVRGDLPSPALCAFPECFVQTPFNSVAGVRARCCGSAHERVLLRLDQCPSLIPPGALFLVSLSGPGIGAWAPTELLVSSDMSVGDLTGYVFVVLLGCAPLSGVSPPLGVSLPLGASFQLRLMPGASVVSDSGSLLLYPPTSGIGASPHLRCLGRQGMTLGEVGIRPHSLLSLSRLPPLSSVLYPADASEAGSSFPAAEAPSPTSALLSAAEGSSGSSSLDSTDDYPTDMSPISSASGSTLAGESGSDSSGSSVLRAAASGEPVSSVARVLLAHDVRPGECLLQTFVGTTPPGVSSQGAGDLDARCALPGCSRYGYFDPMHYQRERCCSLPHEKMLARLEVCPSVMPDGPLLSVRVYGPMHEHPAPPLDLLVSPGMSVEALVDYFFMVFFGHTSSDGDSSGSATDLWQVHLMPGVDLVSTASSILLFPFTPSPFPSPQPPPRNASEVGVQFCSVFQISLLAAQPLAPITGVGRTSDPGSSPGNVRARCALPGCSAFVYYDLRTRPRAYSFRCCGRLHERMLARFEVCPSVMPDGHLTSVSVFGPAHDPPNLPVKLLVSLSMSVEALVDYIFMVFFGQNPNDEDLFSTPGDVPRRWQVRLMPGVNVVSNASSTLLSPLPPGSFLCPRLPSLVASEVGIKFGSVLQVSRLARPFTSDLDSSGSYPSVFSAAPVDTPSALPKSGGASIDAPVDTNALDRFAARLQAWRRDVPLFASLPSVTFDATFGASVDSIISAQLAGVRAALSADRAAPSSEVRPPYDALALVPAFICA